MKQLANTAFIIGSITMLIALVTKATGLEYSGLAFLCGSILSAVGKFSNYKSTDNKVLQRLKIQQILASLLFIATGALMMSSRPGNEWIGSLCIATVLETYSAFRISAIEKHE